MAIKHITLVKIHGYVAVFLLPIIGLYSLTGALYIMGISGKTQVSVFSTPDSTGSAETGDAARSITNDVLMQNGLSPVSSLSDEFPVSGGGFRWRSMERDIIFSRGDGESWDVSVTSKNSYRQLVEIHKDHAGVIFSAFGVLMGASMLLFVITGSLMIFRKDMYRRTATTSLVGGVVATIAAYVITAIV